MKQEHIIDLSVEQAASTFAAISRRISSSFAASASSLVAMISAARSAAFRAPLIATVATGTPLGICTVASSASIPPSVPEGAAIGSPIIGSVVCAASIPARCAAPPAAADLYLGPEELVQADSVDIQVPGWSVPSFVYWDGDDLKNLVVGEGGNPGNQVLDFLGLFC